LDTKVGIVLVTQIDGRLTATTTSWQLPTVLDACHAASVARSAKNSDTNGMNETSQIQSVYLLSVVDAP
jgi:hypothetical protein